VDLLLTLCLDFRYLNWRP